MAFLLRSETGTVRFQKNPFFLPRLPCRATALAVGDFNGDGKSRRGDYGSKLSKELDVLLGNGDGTLGPADLQRGL